MSKARALQRNAFLRSRAKGHFPASPRAVRRRRLSFPHARFPLTLRNSLLVQTSYVHSSASVIVMETRQLQRAPLATPEGTHFDIAYELRGTRSTAEAPSSDAASMSPPHFASHTLLWR